MKNVVILGGTGSIGDSTLEVLNRFPDQFRLFGFVAHKNVSKAENIIKQFKPQIVCLTDDQAALQLKNKVSDVQIISGNEGAEELASHPDVDIVITGIVGAVGLLPTIAAVKAGKRIGIANKEPLVMAGQLMMELAKKHQAEIIPVDSEHSAIFQCLNNHNSDVQNIWLTGSGGPFLNFSEEQLKCVTIEDALNHPTWDMGSKITIDSSTLMNKSLEIIEAHWLFGIPFESIKMIVQIGSLVHSMVEFVDGSTLAQIGLPSMEIPIQYALTYPKRLPNSDNKIDWFSVNQLEFREPNPLLKRSLDYAYEVGKSHPSLGAVLNAANEIAVDKFLKKQIKFLDIFTILEKSLNKFNDVQADTIADIIDLDFNVRQEVSQWIQ
ncbi:MAG: 1-deoxy-D-xylulose-5-phosphate reductoisomerase [Planctomycetota bacterium]|nr:MAG: 1-deoxy-D-xylulose-5-phosphate reductoisomerase [Planctomycetota bacterium]